MTGTLARAGAAIAAADGYTEWVNVHGVFNVSVSGTWSGTLTLQRSFDGGATVVDVETMTANVERLGEEPERGVHYRVGFKSGDYTSGTAQVRISQ